MDDNADEDQPKQADQPAPDRGEDMMFPENFRKLMRIVFGPFNRR